MYCYTKNPVLMENFAFSDLSAGSRRDFPTGMVLVTILPDRKDGTESIKPDQN
jgi:hypothetical protein